MLANNPDLKNIFSHSAQTSGAQPKALAGSVYAYAANINNLEPLLPTVVRIAEKHAVLGVKAEHYGIVAANLMQAIKTVLGDAFTQPLQDAWYHVSLPDENHTICHQWTSADVNTVGLLAACQDLHRRRGRHVRQGCLGRLEGLHRHQAR